MNSTNPKLFEWLCISFLKVLLKWLHDAQMLSVGFCLQQYDQHLAVPFIYSISEAFMAPNITVLIFHQVPFWAYHHPVIKSLIIHKLFSVLLFGVVVPCTLKCCLSLSLGKYSLQKWKQSTWSYVTREGWRQILREKMSDGNNKRV